MTTSIPVFHGLVLSAILFVLGLTGVLVRRNLLFVLLSIEIMLNAAGLAFVVAGTQWFEAEGQVVFLFILALAASGLAVGLALVLQYQRHFKTLDITKVRLMKY